MKNELFDAIYQIERDKGISAETLIDSVEAALITAFKKNFGSSHNVTVEIDRDTGKFKVLELFHVVEVVENIYEQISLEDAKKIDVNYSVGDLIEKEVTPKNFGRIAALAAKQVVVQRIREAERNVIYDSFITRESEIVTGIIQRVSKGIIYIDLGKTEALLLPGEQIATEHYKPGDRIKTYITEVKKTNKAPQIIVSRTHVGLVKRLFELEVPEIHDGQVEIRSISREAGSRSKIAVFSKETNIDPVGSCVGQKGSRVQSVVDELSGEKIDIIEWSEDPIVYITNALNPSKVEKVIINDDRHSALVVVPDYQLSLAIGKEGQNARLAAKLTNWKIDIKSVAQYEEMIKINEKVEA
ncbi:MAG: transcription termination/antitermination protein NusA [Clostridiales bacterium]|nr:transcription termination/antitermination protein NusA [Clostridiales bacterium]